MTCKCGKECAGLTDAPQHQEWDYRMPPPKLLYEVCEHGAVTVDIRPKAAPVAKPVADEDRKGQRR